MKRFHRAGILLGLLVMLVMVMPARAQQPGVQKDGNEQDRRCLYSASPECLRAQPLVSKSQSDVLTPNRIPASNPSSWSAVAYSVYDFSVSAYDVYFMNGNMDPVRLTSEASSTLWRK